MARSTDAGARWGAWLDARLTVAGMRNTELANALGDNPTEATISKWRNGRNPPGGPESVIRVARALHADEVEALTAAGFEELAELVARPAGQGKPLDDTVRILLEADVLDEEDKKMLIELHKQRLDQSHASSKAAIKSAERRRRNTG